MKHDGERGTMTVWPALIRKGGHNERGRKTIHGRNLPTARAGRLPLPLFPDARRGYRGRIDAGDILPGNPAPGTF